MSTDNTNTANTYAQWDAPSGPRLQISPDTITITNRGYGIPFTLTKRSDVIDPWWGTIHESSNSEIYVDFDFNYDDMDSNVLTGQVYTSYESTIPNGEYTVEIMIADGSTVNLKVIVDAPIHND